LNIWKKENEDQMKVYSDNGEKYGYYGYDDAGQRMYKVTLNNTLSRINALGDNVLEVEKLMLYPNGYININQNGEYTKHYYADALRIASKIGTGFSGNICDSAGVIENAYPGYLSDRILKQNEVMQNELYEVALKNPSATLNFVNPYSDFCSIGSGGQETGLFFYHADHLGSTGMVTDINSQVTQGYLYAPFGEILQEYASIDNRIPKYVFNAKELDEENGMYYYSARYYAPPTFISRDPMFEKYPSISPYTYCKNNPIILIDPNGEDWFENESTGEVYFNSEIGKDGAGTGNMEGDGWKWMGDNNMMGTVDNEFVNKYQSLAHEGGGTAGVFNVGDENGFHDGYEMNFGSNSEKFMNEMGYKCVPTQVIEYTKSQIQREHTPGGTISIDIGCSTQLTEKVGYVPNGYKSTGRSQVGQGVYSNGLGYTESAVKYNLSYGKNSNSGLGGKIANAWSALFGGNHDYKKQGPCSPNMGLVNQLRNTK
jgi:RHS repeat-associated protein